MAVEGASRFARLPPTTMLHMVPLPRLHGEAE
jgi:hypothetical protein